MKSWRGMTLIEMVASLAITAIILSALSSAVMVAAGALPKESSERASRATQQMDRMLLDITEAMRVSVSGTTAIRLLVPDRTGNGQPEEIVYGWVGLSGGQIIRSQNGTVSEFLGGVDSLAVELTTGQSGHVALTGTTHPVVKGARVEVKLNGHEPVSREVPIHAEPPVLSGWVRADFDSLPQNVDWDRESGTDWQVTSGSIGNGNISGGVWACSGTLSLRSRWKFTEPTIVSTRVLITRDDRSASLKLVGDCSALGHVELELIVRRMSSSQTRVQINQIGLLSTSTLISQTVGGGVHEVSMVLLPGAKRVRLIIDGVLVGQPSYSTKLGLLANGSLAVSGTDFRVEYDWVEVRVGGVE
ncbi:MAG: prepilin-type N-terminal cleavage/methylation domain-containing protein [Phycisphaeraceae bacterium]|nr:prepilin-type N-terminal cleavage/methylation domain-containing protein [Phycisphaeraceae bacterium]MCW5764010.1 prepilin-type N-terminal cleavage/methylation domain-containing protein [Phycisphaeraceae bacterium]